MEFTNLAKDILFGYRDTILALIAILVTYLLFKKQQKITELSYTEEISSLFNVKDVIKSDLKVYYKEELVKSMHLVKIKLMNTGNTDIASSDFEQELNIMFNDGSEIMNVQITEITPDSLEINYDIQKRNNLIFTPLLLNTKDGFLIQSLIRNYTNYSIKGRIKGVKTVQKYLGPPAYQFLGGALVAMVLFFSLFMGGFYLIFKDITNEYVYRVGVIIYSIPFFYLMLKYDKYVTLFFPKSKM